MNPPQVYMCSPSLTLFPPPSPYHPSGSSQCTSPKHPVSCIEPGLAVSRSLLKFMSVESVMLSNHLILCLTFFFCLQSFPVSGYFSVIQFFASGNQNWVYIYVWLLYLLLELIPLSLYCVLLFLNIVLKSILS